MSAPNPLVGEAEWRGLKLLMNHRQWIGLERKTGKKMPRLVAEYELGLGLDDILTWLGCFAAEPISEDELVAIVQQGSILADYTEALKVISDLMNATFAPPKAAKVRPRKAA